MISAKNFSAHRWPAITLLAAVACLIPATPAQYSAQYPSAPPDAQQPGYADPGQQDPSQVDPPSQVARLSFIQGNVSIQPSGVQEFSGASVNYPLTTGDRLYTDEGALAELQTQQLAVRLGQTTDLSVTSMADNLVQFGLGQGSVHVRSYAVDPNTGLELDTPNLAVTILAAGDLRVDVSPDGSTTQVTLFSGQVRVDANGLQQMLQPGESLQVSGMGPVSAQDVRAPGTDALDRMSADRDSQYQSALASENSYVSADTIGAGDLNTYGDWAPDSDYGPVWYPRGVAADWQPYVSGHWAYIAPWGWTWVGNEPWGFAPFHYGRWWHFPGGRWGWIPGPRVVRPVYSPALVVFVGGGAGISAWFPLGPREPFVPWYRASTLYVNRVNVTNIYNRNTVEVRNIYNQRASNAYTGDSRRVYVNRQGATVAVAQATFASGRPVRGATLHVAPGQFSNAPLLTHPVAVPTRAIMMPGPVRSVPARVERPPVEHRAPVYQNGQNGQNGQGGFNGPRNGGFGQRDSNPRDSAPGNQQPGTEHNNVRPGQGDRVQPGNPGFPNQRPNNPGNQTPANNEHVTPVERPLPGNQGAQQGRAPVNPGNQPPASNQHSTPADRPLPGNQNTPVQPGRAPFNPGNQQPVNNQHSTPGDRPLERPLSENPGTPVQPARTPFNPGNQQPANNQHSTPVERPLPSNQAPAVQPERPVQQPVFREASPQPQRQPDSPAPERSHGNEAPAQPRIDRPAPQRNDRPAPPPPKEQKKDK